MKGFLVEHQISLVIFCGIMLGVAVTNSVVCSTSWLSRTSIQLAQGFRFGSRQK